VPRSGLSERTKQQRAAPGNLVTLYKEALKSYGQAIATFDRCLAHREEALRIYRQTIYSFNEARRSAPNYIYANSNKRLAHGILKEALLKHEAALESYSNAIEVFSRALEIAPLQTTIHEQLEELQRKLGDVVKTRP
jgi:tetratricopeptide (TPR) repeat protein